MRRLDGFGCQAQLGTPGVRLFRCSKFRGGSLARSPIGSSRQLERAKGKAFRAARRRRRNCPDCRSGRGAFKTGSMGLVVDRAGRARGRALPAETVRGLFRARRFWSSIGAGRARVRSLPLVKRRSGRGALVQAPIQNHTCLEPLKRF